MLDTYNAAGFHRLGEIGISETLHELQEIGLRYGFTADDHDMANTVVINLSHDVVQWY